MHNATTLCNGYLVFFQNHGKRIILQDSIIDRRSALDTIIARRYCNNCTIVRPISESNKYVCNAVQIINNRRKNV